MSRAITFDRRRALLLGLSAAFAGMSGTAHSATSISHLLISLGTSSGSNVEAVGRALADNVRAENGTAHVDVEEVEGSQLGLKQCWDAKGQADRLCIVAGSALYAALQGNNETAKQLSGLTIIGSLGFDRRAVFVATRTGINSFAELVAYKDPLVVPTATAISGSQLEALLTNGLTGSRLKPVAGYSYPERKLALMSGEANACVGAIDTFRDLVDQGILRPVLRINDAGAQAPFGELPLLKDVANGPDAQLLTGLVDAIAATNNLVLAPPGLSDAQIADLTAIFDAAAARLTPLKAGGSTAEIVPANRIAVTQRFANLLKNRDTAAEAFDRALACGQALGDGTACAVTG